MYSWNLLVDQVGLKHRDPRAFASRVLGLRLCVDIPGLLILHFKADPMDGVTHYNLLLILQASLPNKESSRVLNALFTWETNS